MKFGLYPRLALAGIRKNKRLYIPYLLTCTGMAMMYYIEDEGEIRFQQLRPRFLQCLFQYNRGQ